MGRRRGILAEIHRGLKAIEREAQRQKREQARLHAAAVRRAEQARRENERAMQRAYGAAERDRKRLEREAKAAYVESRKAEVEEKNLELAEKYDEIDNILAATLDVDDYVDLEKLRKTAEHPPFDRTDLEAPIPKPPRLDLPPEPVLKEPVPPRFPLRRKARHARAIAAAEATHARKHEKWCEKVEKIENKQRAADKEHARQEAERVAELEKERGRYEGECAKRDAEFAEHNKQIDDLITNLGYGTVEAVEEYISIVLSNSIYPDHFPVDHDFTFEPSTAELSLRVVIPPPSELPTIKEYKYKKTDDEITSTKLSQKALKDRYSGAVHNVALRSMHEVFEADRREIIKAISLEVGTEATNPATGKTESMLFVAVASDRATFMDIDLSGVVPAATLEHLGASVSKNPFGLVAAKASGVRRA